MSKTKHTVFFFFEKIWIRMKFFTLQEKNLPSFGYICVRNTWLYVAQRFYAAISFALWPVRNQKGVLAANNTTWPGGVADSPKALSLPIARRIARPKALCAPLLIAFWFSLSGAGRPPEPPCCAGEMKLLRAGRHRNKYTNVDYDDEDNNKTTPMIITIKMKMIQY